MDDVTKYDWNTVRDALYAYADYIEEHEPHAINIIALLRNAADEGPMDCDFE